jgi:hypothetical protein
MFFDASAPFGALFAVIILLRDTGDPVSAAT